ncbi:T6 protein [Hirschfeldia incana]|nr:T6 protein [Hirschfeldia incana]
MANLLHLQLSSPSSSSSLAVSFRRRYCTLNCEIDLWRSFLSRGSVQCRASRGGRFRFRAEDDLFRDGEFDFGFRKKKRPWWWLDEHDDEDDDLLNDDEDWSMVFEVFRTLSWMLAPIGISLLLGTESNAGLMALAVPLVQSVMSLVFSKVLSRPSVVRPIERSRRRATFSRTRKATNTGGGGRVDKEGYKSWMVGDVGDNSTGSRYGGWEDLDKRNEIPLEENVRSKQQFKRGNASRRWRVKEKPLLLRMLFATFPFLSSWTKLLF